MWAAAGPEAGNGWIKSFEFYLEFGFLAKFGNLHMEILKEC
jgi:hypothetical protein